MTPRERFNAIMNFDRPDRPFIWTFVIRKATLDEWLTQGHPEGISTVEYLGYDDFLYVPLITAHYPQFEKIVVEEKDGLITYYDEEGALRIDCIKDQGTGFVTRKWLKFPVESRDDFVKMRNERYNPEDLGRRCEGFEEIIKKHSYVK